LIDDILEAWVATADEQSAGGNVFAYAHRKSPHRLLHMPLEPEINNLDEPHRRFVAGRSQTHGKTRFRDRCEGITLHVPLLEAAHHDRSCRQIDHRAGPEGRDQLAQSLRIFRHVRSSAFAIVLP
jgi:hypothetical protein